MVSAPLENKHLLKIAMIKHRLKAEDVANLTGRTVRTVYSWMSGDRNVPYAIMKIIESVPFSEIDAAAEQPHEPS